MEEKVYAGWKPASVRPPRKGEYLVYGLDTFCPDHIDERDAVWCIKMGYWRGNSRLFNGWSCKVKFWMPLPEYPAGTEKDFRRDNIQDED